jgi:hypothetical protein
MKAVQAFLILVALAFASQATAGQFWSEDRSTNSWIMAANSILVVDCMQTRYAFDNGKNVEEVGLAKYFVGSNPTAREIDRLCVKTLAGMNVLGYFLPESAVTYGRKWNPKKSLYVGVTAIEGVTVANNFIVLGFRSEH